MQVNDMGSLVNRAVLLGAYYFVLWLEYSIALIAFMLLFVTALLTYVALFGSSMPFLSMIPFMPSSIHITGEDFPLIFLVTTIAFYLPERLRVRLEVFDVAGRLVARLGDGVFGAGPHDLTWDGTDANGASVSSGVYVYRLTAGNRTISKKMILLK